MKKCRLMHLVEAFLSRFQFQPPPEFSHLADGRGSIQWVELPGFRWLAAEEIAGWQFSEEHWEGFVPFGTNEEGDLWCWCPEMAVTERVPVGYCPVNCEEGEIYARDFASALLRIVCDCAQHLSARPASQAAARGLLRAAAENAQGVLPAAWREWLIAQSGGALSVWLTSAGPQQGIPGREDYDRMLADFADDGELGAVFRWMSPQ